MKHTLILAALALISCNKLEKMSAYKSNQIATVESENASGITRELDFERAFLDPKTFNLIDNGYTYRFITKGTYSDPEITVDEYFKGHASIAYRMPHTKPSGSVTNDKSQHTISTGSDKDAMGFGDQRFYGFAVKLDALTDQPIKPCELFQIWQGSPMSPPVDLSIVPGGNDDTFNIRLSYRNNLTTANPSAGLTVCTSSIQRGVWNTFELMTVLRNADDEADGRIKLWINSELIVNWCGRAGYTEGVSYGGLPRTPNAKFNSYFGPYRACQLADVVMYYDQVKYATTFEGADPN